jgi:hypothetical protein
MKVEEILNKIKNLKEVKAINEAELAEMLGCSTQQIWDIFYRIRTVKIMQRNNKTLNPRGLKYVGFDCCKPDNLNEPITINFKDQNVYS